MHLQSSVGYWAQVGWRCPCASVSDIKRHDNETSEVHGSKHESKSALKRRFISSRHLGMIKIQPCFGFISKKLKCDYFFLHALTTVSRNIISSNMSVCFQLIQNNEFWSFSGYLLDLFKPIQTGNSSSKRFLIHDHCESGTTISPLLVPITCVFSDTDPAELS